MPIALHGNCKVSEVHIGQCAECLQYKARDCSNERAAGRRKEERIYDRRNPISRTHCNQAQKLEHTLNRAV
jgi:hypothetical protein